MNIYNIYSNLYYMHNSNTISYGTVHRKLNKYRALYCIIVKRHWDYKLQYTVLYCIFRETDHPSTCTRYHLRQGYEHLQYSTQSLQYCTSAVVQGTYSSTVQCSTVFILYCSTIHILCHNSPVTGVHCSHRL